MDFTNLHILHNHFFLQLLLTDGLGVVGATGAVGPCSVSAIACSVSAIAIIAAAVTGRLDGTYIIV